MPARAAPAPMPRKPRRIAWIAAAAALAAMLAGVIFASRKPEAAVTSEAAAPSTAAKGVVQIDVSPWAQVEVDGVAAGIAPPLTQLALPVGRHTITLRHGELATQNVVVDVVTGAPSVIEHRFAP